MTSEPAAAVRTWFDQHCPSDQDKKMIRSSAPSADRCGTAPALTTRYAV
jgi:hypothetical protein